MTKTLSTGSSCLHMFVLMSCILSCPINFAGGSLSPRSVSLATNSAEISLATLQVYDVDPKSLRAPAVEKK